MCQHCVAPLQDCTRAEGSAVLLSKTSRGWGQPGPGHRSWQEQNLKGLLLGGKSSHPLAVACVWVDFAGVACQDFAEDAQSFQSKCKEAPELGSKGTHYGSKGTVWDSHLGQLAHKPSNAPVNPGPG